MHKVLLIGAGSICRTHIDAFEGLHGCAKVVGIVARHQESAQKAIDNADLDAKAYTDYKQAIAESGCDIVSVRPPPGTHKETPSTRWSMAPCYGRKADGPLAAGM